MDNITHTLIGLALGEAAVQTQDPKNQKRLRPLFWLASAIANNLPDLDVLYTGITTGKIGRLLHHRGHTHTISIALLQGLMIWLGFWLWSKSKKRTAPQKKDLPVLFILSLLGPLAHIAMDYSNSYGVHPFWPIDNNWYYGDALFIVEPLLWLALLPALIFGAESPKGRTVLSALFCLAIGLMIFSGYVSWQIAVTATLLAVWLLGLMFKLKPIPRISSSIGIAVLIVGAFFSISHQVRKHLYTRIALQFPSATIIDIVLTPYPANPICWSVDTILREGDAYRVRRAIFSAAPHWIPVAACPDIIPKETTAKLTPVNAQQSAELWWLDEFAGSVKELQSLNQKYCGISALLRFIRVPVWSFLNDENLIFGDLRYDRSTRLDFAEVLFGPQGNGSECPANIPPWHSPRQELLSSGL